MLMVCLGMWDSWSVLIFVIFVLIWRVVCIFFLMIRRPPRSTQSRSSAASDVYKRQNQPGPDAGKRARRGPKPCWGGSVVSAGSRAGVCPVSYTHLRAHETVLDLVCRLLLEKKKDKTHQDTWHVLTQKMTRRAQTKHHTLNQPPPN